MSRVIWKTIYSSEHEIPLILMSILELQEIVDIFIVSESDITHSGETRAFTFEEHADSIFHVIPDKLHYIKINLSSEAKRWDGNVMRSHDNEQLIRDGFRQGFDVQSDDIVISVDADEVLYQRSVSKFLRKISRSRDLDLCYRLRLNQFIFKLSYFWPEMLFEGPIIARASYFMNQTAPQWRYGGKRTRTPSGVHFSWLMNTELMAAKMINWAHRDESEMFANPKLLEWAISNRILIWDPKRSFNIRELKYFTKNIHPEALKKIYDIFPDCLK